MSHTDLDENTKKIVAEMLDFQNVCAYSNKKLESLLAKLDPEMKATKFKKYKGAIASLRASAEELNTKSEEIEESLDKIRDARISEMFLPDCENEKTHHPELNHYQKNLFMGASQNNIYPSLM